MKIWRKIFPALALLLLPAASLSGATAGQMNNRLGLPLWSLHETSLWSEDAETVLKRLKIRFAKSEADGMTIYSAYPRNFRSCDTDLNQIKIFASGGRLSRVDLIFANKGDDARENSQSRFKRSFRKELRAVSSQLSNRLGAPRRGEYGAAGSGNSVEMWDFGDSVLALDEEKNEYIVLHILPASALKDGKSAVSGRRRIRRSDVAGNIVRRENGDVYLGNIPMIDQGGKGYCAPATVERCLLYYGIREIDMHKIANLADTGYGGSTSVGNLLAASQKLARPYNLRFLPLGLAMKEIKRQIDGGAPILWALFSTDEYVARMKENTAKRAELPFDSWKKRLKRQRSLRNREEDPHLCLIIGYNEDSGEIAVSNSWGKGFELNWIRLVDAQRVTQNCSLFALAAGD